MQLVYTIATAYLTIGYAVVLYFYAHERAAEFVNGKPTFRLVLQVIAIVVLTAPIAPIFGKRLIRFAQRRVQNSKQRFV